MQLLQEALTEKAGHKVSLNVPQLGNRRRLIEHALQNAKQGLSQRMAESSSQQKLLQSVADIFGLPTPPRRIEVYDNSHIQGSNPVGAMIAAGAEGFLKKTYRKFNIRAAEVTNDDYAMMAEVLTRRFSRLIEEDPERKSGMWPDLVLIDGGQGQINKVWSVFSELGISDVPAIGIAKGPDRNAGRERFFMAEREPFCLPEQDPVLYYLQRLRDEAHRFAIGAHRKKRQKQISMSGLEDVPGVGPTRKKALLHHFGSAKAVSQAGIDDLTKVPGISASSAKKIYDFFHANG
jgi:excinuclease ABC subunit C